MPGFFILVRGIIRTPEKEIASKCARGHLECAIFCTLKVPFPFIRPVPAICPHCPHSVPGPWGHGKPRRYWLSPLSPRKNSGDALKWGKSDIRKGRALRICVFCGLWRECMHASRARARVCAKVLPEHLHARGRRAAKIDCFPAPMGCCLVLPGMGARLRNRVQNRVQTRTNDHINPDTERLS